MLIVTGLICGILSGAMWLNQDFWFTAYVLRPPDPEKPNSLCATLDSDYGVITLTIWDEAPLRRALNLWGVNRLFRISQGTTQFLSYGIGISLAAWIPFLLFAVLPLSICGIRARRKHRWARQRRCLNCGYSLIGNTSGVCPECGTAACAKSICRCSRWTVTAGRWAVTWPTAFGLLLAVLGALSWLNHGLEFTVRGDRAALQILNGKVALHFLTNWRPQPISAGERWEFGGICSVGWVATSEAFSRCTIAVSAWTLLLLFGAVPFALLGFRARRTRRRRASSAAGNAATR